MGHLAAAMALVDEAIEQTSRRLDGQPDNPRIHRFGSGASAPSAFAVRFSDMLSAGNHLQRSTT